MKIKKITMLLLIIFGAAMAMPACSSVQSKAPDDAPKEVKKAVKDAPRNALIGIGKATGSATSQLTETIAITRARTAISRQLNTMVREMILTYRAESSLDDSAALAFEENITIALSASTITGSVVWFQMREDNGTAWAVVVLDKNNAAKEITRAQNEAKAKIPEAASVDITVKIDAAFEAAVSAGPQVN